MRLPVLSGPPLAGGIWGGRKVWPPPSAKRWGGPIPPEPRLGGGGQIVAFLGDFGGGFCVRFQNFRLRRTWFEDVISFGLFAFQHSCPLPTIAYKMHKNNKAQDVVSE